MAKWRMIDGAALEDGVDWKGTGVGFIKAHGIKHSVGVPPFFWQAEGQTGRVQKRETNPILRAGFNLSSQH